MLEKSNAANHTQRFANHHRANAWHLVVDDTLAAQHQPGASLPRNQS